MRARTQLQLIQLPPGRTMTRSQKPQYTSAEEGSSAAMQLAQQQHQQQQRQLERPPLPQEVCTMGCGEVRGAANLPPLKSARKRFRKEDRRKGNSAGRKRRINQSLNLQPDRQRCEEIIIMEAAGSRRKRIRARRRLGTHLLLPLLLLSSTILPDAQASVECETSDQCTNLLGRPGSECIDNQCTNPFQKGCLRSYLGQDAFPSFRTCNSEDTLGSMATETPNSNNNSQAACTLSPLLYSEIRILSQNWESAMLSAWILQIVLSELFQVPATIESSGPGRQLNFYDPAMSFSYGAMGYDFDALERANTHGGGTCPPEWRQSPDDTNYQSCAHVIPEVWSGHAATVANLTGRGVLEPPEGTGVVGKLSWFIPKFVAREDPSMSHWLGLTGSENRRRVAETFKVPTTYGMYCSEIVPHNCTEPTLFASRPPADKAEAAKYFVAGGAFQGYFRFTEENDCDLNPDTCVGHVTDVPCEWTTFVTPQSHYLDLPVQSRGSLTPNSAYTYGELLDIWAAANATRSAILFYWWYPDPTYQLYLGSEAEMQAVQLPPPRQECVTNRVTPAQRCSEIDEERLGEELGSCDAEPHSLLKLVIANLYHYLNGRSPENENPSNNQSTTDESNSPARQNPAFRSPAHDAIQAFSITELQLGEILDAWEQRGLDKWNYDPREAVCEWVVQNLDTLQTWIPRTYPRVVQQDAYNHGNELLYGFAVGFGVVVSLLVFGTFILTYVWRNRPLLVFAQVNFLYFLLFGLELVAVGSVLVALEPKDATCVLQNWFILLGYTLELVPLIVKVGAIHRMMRAAKRLKRITLDQRRLHLTVLLFCFLATIVLTVWTAVDPSQRNSEITLHPNRQTDDGETIVTITHFCGSEDSDAVWRYLSLCWQVLLLLFATILAFQTRNIRQDLNESHTLGVMVYSHFVFVVLRVITFVLGSAGGDENGDGAIDRNTLEGVRSLLLSLDVFAATSVYFGPKMYSLFKYDDEYFKAIMAIQRRQSVFHRSSVQRSSLHGSASNGLHYAGSQMMQSSFSQLASVAGGGSGSGDPNPLNSGFDSRSSEQTRKRRSSSKLSLLVDADIAESAEEIDWVPSPNVKENSARKLSEDDLSMIMSEQNGNEESADDASLDLEDVKAALPMTSSKSAQSSDSECSEEMKDSFALKEAPKEAHPLHASATIESGQDQDILSAIANLREGALAHNSEKEAAAIARAERRHSRASLTETMILDFIGTSSNQENGVASVRRSKWRSSHDTRQATPSDSSWRQSSASQEDPEAAPTTEISIAGNLSHRSESDLETSPAGKIPAVQSIVTVEDESSSRRFSIDEQQFEQLYNDDDDLSDNHYFF